MSTVKSYDVLTHITLRPQFRFRFWESIVDIVVKLRWRHLVLIFSSSKMSLLIQTRGQTICPVIGPPAELCDLVLPTYHDVMKYFQWVRNEKKIHGNKKEPAFASIADSVAARIESIWERASIPVLHRVTIIQMIRKKHDIYKNLIKSYKSRSNTSVTFISQVNNFKESLNKLFDIATCKCKELLSSCQCDKERKIPVREREFLIDQRTERKLVISSLDKTTTRILQKRAARQTNEENKISKHSKLDTLSCNLPSTSGMQEQRDDLDYHGDDSSEVPRSEVQKVTQTRMDLTNFSRICDRFSIADRPAAALASAVLKDVKIVEVSDAIVIDRNKVRRARQKTRANLQVEAHSENSQPLALYFDGRKDSTIFIEKDQIGHSHRKVRTEEHVSVLGNSGESDSYYLGHTSPTSSSAIEIKRSIMTLISENNVDISKLSAIGCDGTVTNTGRNGGIIRLVELEIKRPLLWIICELHRNELPLRHLIGHLDGYTTGPRGFSGPIGKSLATCHELPIIKFDVIETDMPLVDINDLSTDQKYLFDICKALSSGECSANLAAKSPGKLSHARWLTLANRILRLYVSSSNPTQNLLVLVTFIMKVYAPMWFHIKCNPTCKDGPKNLFKTIQLSRYLSDDLKSVIHPVIERNAYFAHPENILFAMLSDERKYIQKLAVRRILKSRSTLTQDVRKFNIPPINFYANDYIDMINWQECVITEPPVTFHFSNEQLDSFLKEDIPEIPLPSKFPSHTQSVERCVKEVTAASKQVCGQSSRDGFIRTRLMDRSLMPSFETKSEFPI